MTKSKKKKNKGIKTGDNRDSREVKKIITIILVVLAFLGLFYLLTLWILGRDVAPSISSNDETGEVEIQDEEILVGTSFSVSDEEYLVLYYDVDADEEKKVLSNLVSQYRSSSSDLNLYTVDLSDSLNKRFITEEEGNSSATKASELKLKNPTLIKFVDGKISEYLEGEEEIKSYLK